MGATVFDIFLVFNIDSFETITVNGVEHAKGSQEYLAGLTTMKIRQANIEDTEALSELCSQVHQLHIKLQPLIFREPLHQELVGVFRDRILDPDYTAYIAFDGDRPVGYVLFHIIRKPGNVFAHSRNLVEIDQIHVVERCWGQGVCKKLFAKAHEVARSFDIENIQLGVWTQNHRAIAAFNALGFKQQWQIMALETKAKLEPSNALDNQGGAAVTD